MFFLNCINCSYISTQCFLILVIENSEEAKFHLGNSFFHILASRSEHEYLERLLRGMSAEQRIRMSTSRNHRGETVYDVAKSYKVKRILQWADLQEEYYYLRTPPVVLMMPILNDREQAQEEIVQLETAFPQFNVRFKRCNNPDKEEMLSAIQNVVRENGEASALIVIIMAHGVQGRIRAADGNEVPIQDILFRMQAALPHGEPKVRMYYINFKLIIFLLVFSHHFSCGR